MAGLIHNCDKSAYRDEVQFISEWCSINNLTFDTSKTKDLIINFRKHKEEPPPLHIREDKVERVNSFKILGTRISQDLTWCFITTSQVKKAQRRLYFLRTLRKANLSKQLLVSFYRCSVDGILTYCIMV